MKIVCCPTLSRDLDFEGNFCRMEEQAKVAAAQGADLALFGEAYLQGFGGMSFDYKTDIPNAYAQNNEEIAQVRNLAKHLGIALGFGFFENHQGGVYSAYLILDKDGETVDLFRRVSVGWKEEKGFLNPDYREGLGFHSFKFQGKRFATMICGDFWENHLISQIIELDDEVDAFFWPVHCDYDPQFWEAGEREEYRERGEILAKPVLFINNYRDPETEEKAPESKEAAEMPSYAQGGAYVWQQGKTLAALEMKRKGILLFEL